MTRNSVFFASFNARHLDAEEIATAFVPNSQFRQLASPQNALLVGPRGSGKTHLLKMLQPKSLASWDHEESDEIRRRVGFLGVFVPADEAWNQQIECAAIGLGDVMSQFTDSVFVTHFQKALVEAMLQTQQDRPHADNGFFRSDLSRAKEGELCCLLADSWNLRPRIKSLISIKQSLVDRLADFQDAAISGANSVRSVLAVSQKRLMGAASQGIEAFNGVSGRHQTRWGLLFDELEIAPSAVQQTLFQSLRSTNQHIVLKLAISPSVSAAEVFRSILGPSAGNDFEEISLYTDTREAQIFCELLWKKVAAESSNSVAIPTAVLRHSAFHAPETGNRYSRNGTWQSAFLELSRKDRSFCTLMQQKGVDPGALERASRQLMDSVIRKVAPLVGYRNLLLARGPGLSGEKAERKKGKISKAKLYSGWEALCLISEANPRWFTGMARQLMIERTKGTSGRDLSVEAQYRIIEGASKKFMSYLATIPTKTRPEEESLCLGLKELVEGLLVSFSSGVLDEKFSMDPALSFTFSDDIPDSLKEAIVDGIYSGAFVPLEGLEKGSIFSKLSGARFRLTYLLAPLGPLPLRSGKSRKLSSILSKSINAQSSKKSLLGTFSVSEAVQESLFHE